MRTRIERTLVYEDHDGARTVIRQGEIVSLNRPVVILGDPGLGKSVLAEQLGERSGIQFVCASSFVSHDNPRSLLAVDNCPVIDGLDEIASVTPGAAVVDVLKQLSKLGNPSFILTCRAADWRGAADRVRILAHYGAEPALLHLQPFGRNDAHEYLSRQFPAIEPAAVLDHLERCGIESLYENPLTLRMLGEVAENQGALPETRAHLFDRACRVMLEECNPGHQRDTHARRPDEDLLRAAGAVCAAQLLSGYLSIHDGPNADTQKGFLNLSEFAGLPYADLAVDAVRTRLFLAQGENRFVPVHRVIAEYLGAKWLARCFEDEVSEKRIFSLFRQGEGVPTSLRGLHAWLAHFNGVLARRCIEADPYAVLRYGDAETLTLEQARALLDALKGLSEDDPYFRSEDWGQHPVSGLMRPELRDEVRAILETRDRHAQLRGLLLEAISAASLAKELLPTLQSITFDRSRDVEERSTASEALQTACMNGDCEPLIDRLLAMDDLDSARLAFEFLCRAGLFGVPEATSIRTVLAYFGVSLKRTSEDEPLGLRYVPDSFLSDLDTKRLASWLDALVETILPLIDNAHFEANWHLTRLVGRVAAHILEADPAVRAERVWKWLGWLAGHQGLDPDTDKRLVAVFRDNEALRAAILEHVLLTPCAENTFMAGRELSQTPLGLHLTGQDLAGMMRTLRTRAGADAIDRETWRDLLLLGRTADGLPADLRAAALQCANADAELLSILDDMSESPAVEWKTRQAERDAEDEARRQKAFRIHRHILAEKPEDISAGDTHILYTAAAVYLGHTWALRPELHFESELPRHERLRAFLDDALAERVMAGFITSLHRDDLPSAARIAQAHTENEHCVAEAPMICGIAELLRRGYPLDGIDRATLAAAYMALRLGPESDSAEPNPIGEALEGELFHCVADWELHFRTSIEPQLDRNYHHLRELYRLTHEPRFAGLTGRLSVDWLRRYPGLNLHVQSRLLPCALEKAPKDELRSLLVDVRNRAHADPATGQLWLSADYALDLEDRRPALEAAAADNRNLIWSVRDRIAPRNGERIDRFSLDHLVFIVEAFGDSWPNVPTPTGRREPIMGDCNPCDASEFIRQTIYAIAGNPSPDATSALQGLIHGHAPTYAETAKHALALQRRVRRDHEYTSPCIAELRAVVEDGLPVNIDDMQAWFADRIEQLKARMRASDTDMWAAYWSEDARPRHENFCRNRMIEHLSGQMPESIRFGPETHMPAGTRADIAVTRNAIKLPVEIKGQWNDDVWDAAVDQLAARYSIDWQAEGRGVYIVLWFGDGPGKHLPSHPDGLERPASPEELRLMLVDRLPESLRTSIDVYVIDVSRPKDTG